MPLRFVLPLLLLLAPAPTRAAPPETDPLQPAHVALKDQGHRRGRPFVVLALHPVSREPALERLTVEEARTFVQALEESFGATRDRAVNEPSPFATSGLFLGPRPPGSASVARLERRIREEYESLYGPPVFPLPEALPKSRFVAALARSPRYMPEGVRAGAQELLSSEAVLMALAASGMTYLALWLAPEPAFSKAIASTLTLGLMVVYGVAEVVNVARAFVQLYRDAQAASTPEQLESAAARFGTSMGKVGLRIMVMAAGGALKKSLPDIPKGGLSSFLPARQQLLAAGPNGSKVVVTVSPGASTQVNVSSGTAVLMGASASAASAAASAAVSSARTSGACRPESDRGEAHGHHISTNKNNICDKSGGPWTPKFLRLFSRAGMSLDDPANIVYLIAHQGPHPMEYHLEVHDRLEKALGDCNTRSECRSRLIEELDRIAASICTPGSKLNKLITKQP